MRAGVRWALAYAGLGFVVAGGATILSRYEKVQQQQADAEQRRSLLGEAVDQRRDEVTERFEKKHGRLQRKIDNVENDIEVRRQRLDAIAARYREQLSVLQVSRRAAADVGDERQVSELRAQAAKLEAKQADASLVSHRKLERAEAALKALEVQRAEAVAVAARDVELVQTEYDQALAQIESEYGGLGMGSIRGAVIALLLGLAMLAASVLRRRPVVQASDSDRDETPVRPPLRLSGRR